MVQLFSGEKLNSLSCENRDGEGYRKGRRDGGSGAPGKEPPGEWGGCEVTSGEGGVKSGLAIKAGCRSEATLNKEMGAPAVGSVLGLVLRPRRWHACCPLALAHTLN